MSSMRDLILAAAGSASGSSGPDPYFKNVALLLTGDNASGQINSTFLDNGVSNGITLTPSGSPQPSQFSPFSNTGWSGSFNGSTDVLTTSTSLFSTWSTANASTQTATIEAFIYVNALQSAPANVYLNPSIISKGATYLTFAVTNTGNLLFYHYDGTARSVTSTGTIATNTWVHVAAVIAGGIVTLYINGSAAGTGTWFGIQSVGLTSSTFIGQTTSGQFFNGYISNLRVSSVARVISTPASAYASDANTSFLTLQDNRFRDASSNAYTLTTSGTPKIVATSPFTPATYNPAVHGASFYTSDASANYIGVATTSALTTFTGDFTIECWVWRNATAVANNPFGILEMRSTSGGVPWSWFIWDGVSGSGTGALNFYNGTDRYSTATVANNQWHHVVVSRSGSTISQFINGKKDVTTFTLSGTITGSATTARIGSMTNNFATSGYIASMRVVNGVAIYSGDFTPPIGPLATSGAASASAYPSTTNVNTTFAASACSLLALQSPYSSSNNHFLDTSNNSFPITRTGTPTQGSFSPFSPAGWSTYFAGGTDALTVSSSLPLIISGAFIVEGFLNLSVTDTSTDYVLHNFNGTNGFSLRVNQSSAGSIELYNGTTAILSYAANLQVGRWYYIVLSRDTSNVLTLYIDGVSATSVTSAANFSGSLTSTVIGNYSGTNGFQGYISNLMVRQGAYYSSAPSVPSAPFSSALSPAMLVCHMNRFKDGGTGNYTITVAGTPKIQSFAPFTPTTTYLPAVHGGSGYFASGDYLNAGASASPSGTQDFTIEFCYYPVSRLGNYPALFCNRTVYSATAGLSIFDRHATTPTVFRVEGCGVTLVGTTVVSNNQHYTIAVTRQLSGGVYTLRLYVNGNLDASATGATGSLSADALFIGRADTTNLAASYINGFVSNYRVTAGTALYTGSTYSLPTAPLTAISGTSLLLNFTNGAVVDATGRNDLITVGSAQVSAAASKWGTGTGAIKFNGSTDYLLQTANMQPFIFGTGDFTIEMWVYFNTTSVQQALFGFRPAITNGLYPIMYFQSGTLRYNVNGVDVLSCSVSSGSFMHVAVCRSGTSTRLFLNGTQQGTTYPDTNNYTASRLVIGADDYSLGTTPLNGYIDDFRISRYARYTANFTAPTAPLPIQ